MYTFSNKNFIKHVVPYVSIFFKEILKPVYSGRLSITNTFGGPVTIRYVEVSLYIDFITLL